MTEASWVGGRLVGCPAPLRAGTWGTRTFSGKVLKLIVLLGRSSLLGSSGVGAVAGVGDGGVLGARSGLRSGGHGGEQWGVGCSWGGGGDGGGSGSWGSVRRGW